MREYRDRVSAYRMFDLYLTLLDYLTKNDISPLELPSMDPPGKHFGCAVGEYGAGPFRLHLAIRFDMFTSCEEFKEYLEGSQLARLFKEAEYLYDISCDIYSEGPTFQVGMGIYFIPRDAGVLTAEIVLLGNKWIEYSAKLDSEKVLEDVNLLKSIDGRIYSIYAHTDSVTLPEPFAKADVSAEDIEEYFYEAGGEIAKQLLQVLRGIFHPDNWTKEFVLGAGEQVMRLLSPENYDKLLGEVLEFKKQLQHA